VRRRTTITEVDGFRPPMACYRCGNRPNVVITGDEPFEVYRLYRGWFVHRGQITCPTCMQKISDRDQRGRCLFRFRSDLCGYIGDADACDKKFTTCCKLDNQGRFGGFPPIDDRENKR
jgi:hypothetical protein